mmetsp:Transcript_6690/g.11849  ORF Transcript_6690/g.11849 Transcript_6690/m.11849 type:complete len:280 (+) Transcript_6690:70-909(+)
MLKGSPYNSILISHKRSPASKSTVNIGAYFPKAAEQSLTSSSKAFSKIKSRQFKSTALLHKSPKKKQDLFLTPQHNKSKSSACIDGDKISDPLRSRLTSLSPQTRASQDVGTVDGSLDYIAKKLSRELAYRLQQCRPVDCVQRSYESLQILKVLGKSSTELESVISVAVKEIEECLSSRKVLERKLEQIARENYSLSKQLDMQDTQTKPNPDPVYDILMQENQLLKLQIREYEAQLKVKESPLAQQHISLKNLPTLPDGLRNYQGTANEDGLQASRLRE